MIFNYYQEKYQSLTWPPRPQMRWPYFSLWYFFVSSLILFIHHNFLISSFIWTFYILFRTEWLNLSDGNVSFRCPIYILFPTSLTILESVYFFGNTHHSCNYLIIAIFLRHTYFFSWLWVPCDWEPHLSFSSKSSVPRTVLATKLALSK